MNEETKQKIENIINSDKVVIFMKWTKSEPVCGFTVNIIWIMNMAWIEFTDVNIFDDEEIAEWIKEYNNWPTYPQIHINWEFVWWFDIVAEMFETWELQELVNK